MDAKLTITHKYDDIIDLPYPLPGLPTRPRMSIQDRAAQFAPFAALSGHGAAIRETARLTDQRIELEEDQLVVLNEQLQKIMDRVGEHPEVSVLYFKPDGKKDGGAYVTVTGKGELLGYKYPSFRAAARMTPCCSLSFIPAYPDLQDDADHPRCSATG